MADAHEARVRTYQPAQLAQGHNPQRSKGEPIQRRETAAHPGY